MKTLLILLMLFPLITGLALADEPTQLPFVTGLPGSLVHSAVEGGHAFCSTSGGLMVLDVSDSTQPIQVAMLPLPSWGREIAVDGEHAYLLVWDVGLVVIDIQNPAAPRIVATVPEPVRSSSIAISGHHAYISDMGLGLCVVDILDPTQPQLLATRPLTDELYGLDVEGDVVYVAANYDDLHVLDVSTPSAPALITTASLPGLVRDVAVRNGLAYLACGDHGLRVLLVTDPAAPIQIAQQDMEFDLGYPNWTSSVSLNGNHACMGLTFRGLGLVDITNPSAPVEVAYHEIRGSTYASYIGNDLAYVASSHGGLTVMDISSPKVPQVLSQFWLLGMVTDVEVADDKIWVAGGYSPTDEKSLRSHDAGLFVVEMTERETPRVIGYCSTGLEPRYLVRSGHHAYLTTPFGGIRIQDVADPTAPVEVGSIPTFAESYAPDVRGNYAYTFAGAGFAVMDVSDPSMPMEAGSCDVDYVGHLTAGRLAVFNTIGHRGLLVFDVSDPKRPAPMTELELPSGARESTLLGDHLYVANGLYGMSVVDVSDPSQPSLVGTVDLPGYVTSVACNWPYAYLVAMEFIEEPGGVLVVDISNPAAPVHVAGSELPGDAEAVSVDGSLVYVGSRWKGVMIFLHDTTSDVPMSSSPAAYLRNHPNPFNPRTLITFEVPVSAHVQVSVYDLAGRLVRTLVDEMKPTGTHEVSWDGLDSHGRPVSSGVYLGRMNAGGNGYGCTMVLTR